MSYYNHIPINFRQSPNTFENFEQGPAEQEIDWYPWMDIDSLDFDICKIA